MSQDIELIRLGNHINTSYNEGKPILTDDLTSLYFTREYYPGNTNGKRDAQDIYVGHMKDGKWVDIKNVSTPLNNKEPNGISSISNDGSTFLLIDGYSNSGDLGVAAISKRMNGSWTSPTPIKIEGFQNSSPYSDYALSSDGEFLLLAIESSESLGDQDLYVSQRLNGDKWSHPINLGMTVNTEFAEFAPFLSPDNEGLFFASYGHNSMGESDIFFCKRLDDTWTNWSKPENLGTPVNSPYFEAYFSFSKNSDYAYFVSDNDSAVAGSRDIFMVKLSQKYKPDPRLEYQIVVLDESGLQIEHASLTISTGREGETSNHVTTSDGAAHKFLADDKVIIQANANGYMTPVQIFDLSKVSDKTIQIQMTKVDKDVSIPINDVPFVSTEMPDHDYTEMQIQNVRRIMMENITTKVGLYLEKKVDENGDGEDDRFQKIEKRLTQAGILMKRLELGIKNESAQNLSKDDFQMICARENVRLKILSMNWLADLVADTDKDGVLDRDDDCPNEMGSVQNKGCPKKEEEVKEIFAKALTGIRFESSKAILKSASYSILDEIVEIMNERPQFHLKIAGHTDSSGDANVNLKLSEKRAKATKEYLENKGVNGDRLSYEGFGETKPIASNSSYAGRAKNRRVEFKLVPNGMLSDAK